MQLSEVKQVKQVIGVSNANASLQEGWTLLAVVHATVPASDVSSALYVLGKSEPAEPKKVDIGSMTIEQLQADAAAGKA